MLLFSKLEIFIKIKKNLFSLVHIKIHELKYFIIKDLNTPLDRLIENRKHKCKNWTRLY